MVPSNAFGTVCHRSGTQGWERREREAGIQRDRYRETGRETGRVVGIERGREREAEREAVGDAGSVARDSPSRCISQSLRRSKSVVGWNVEWDARCQSKSEDGMVWSGGTDGGM